MEIILTVIGAAALIFLIYALFMLRPRAKKPADPSLLCDYAHRGLYGNGVPENSLAAFALACEAGVGIELDVQLSADGEVMVFHDYSLERMTGRPAKVCETSAEELGSLSLSGTDQTVPTFAQVLSLVDGRVPVLVELKGEDADVSLCGKTAALLSEYGGRYCIESFNPLLIREIKKFLPDAYCGILYTDVCREKKRVSALNLALSLMAVNFLARPDFIAYCKTYRKKLPVRLCTGLFRAGRFVWTVRGDEELKEAHRNGECPIFERNGFASEKGAENL